MNEKYIHENVVDVVDYQRRLLGARFVAKRESNLMLAISWLLKLLGNKRFMAAYWTTIGSTIYYPSHVHEPNQHPIVVEHELVHVRQWKKWNILFWLGYLFFPLPGLFAYLRWRWEREAYLVNLRYVQNKEAEIDRIVNNLWYDYFYTWPRGWMRRWFRENA